MKTRTLKNRYPFPQCVVTPLVLVLGIVALEAPRQLTWEATREFGARMWTSYFSDSSATTSQLATEAPAEPHASDSPFIQRVLNPTKLQKYKSTLTSSNLWDHVREGFGLSGYEHPLVDVQLNWYVKNQSYINRVTDRASPYLYFILNELNNRHIPTEIALLPIVESAYQPFAFSAGRAAGIWQFIPPTAQHYQLIQNWWYDGRRDIFASTLAALDFLQDLNTAFDGDWLLALAAYNSGRGTVSRAIKQNTLEGKPAKFWDLDLPQETRDYVPKLLAISALVADPEYYHIKLKPLPYMPYFVRINVQAQIDLAKAAELAEISIEELYRLNPAFNRWATAPEGPHYLLIPYENAELFRSNLENYKPEDRIQWKRYIVQKNEPLRLIAMNNGTTVDTLRRINKLESNQLPAGKNLVIPITPKGLSNYLTSLESNKLDAQLTTNPKQKLEHTVEDGETLWGISQEYNISLSKLAAWNNMDMDDVLIKGKKLVIWANNDMEENDLLDALIPTTFAALPTHTVTRQVKYRVRDGDSLATISQKFNVTVNQLISWNHLPKGRLLKPGQLLTLFVDVTRQSENI